MTVRARDLVRRAELGLPYESKKVVRRALMHLPWRMFVGRQVEFNRAVAEAVTELNRSVKRVEKRLDQVVADTEAILLAHRESGATAVREQLYDTEGVLRRELGELQLRLAALEAAAEQSPTSRPS